MKKIMFSFLVAGLITTSGATVVSCSSSPTHSGGSKTTYNLDDLPTSGLMVDQTVQGQSDSVDNATLNQAAWKAQLAEAWIGASNIPVQSKQALRTYLDNPQTTFKVTTGTMAINTTSHLTVSVPLMGTHQTKTFNLSVQYVAAPKVAQAQLNPNKAKNDNGSALPVFASEQQFEAYSQAIFRDLSIDPITTPQWLNVNTNNAGTSQLFKLLAMQLDPILTFSELNLLDFDDQPQKLTPASINEVKLEINAMVQGAKTASILKDTEPWMVTVSHDPQQSAKIVTSLFEHDAATKTTFYLPASVYWTLENELNLNGSWAQETDNRALNVALYFIEQENPHLTPYIESVKNDFTLTGLLVNRLQGDPGTEGQVYPTTVTWRWFTSPVTPQTLNPDFSPYLGPSFSFEDVPAANPQSNTDNPNKKIPYTDKVKSDLSQNINVVASGTNPLLNERVRLNSLMTAWVLNNHNYVDNGYFWPGNYASEHKAGPSPFAYDTNNQAYNPYYYYFHQSELTKYHLNYSDQIVYTAANLFPALWNDPQNQYFSGGAEGVAIPTGNTLNGQPFVVDRYGLNFSESKYPVNKPKHWLVGDDAYSATTYEYTHKWATDWPDPESDLEMLEAQTVDQLVVPWLLPNLNQIAPTLTSHEEDPGQTTSVPFNAIYYPISFGLQQTDPKKAYPSKDDIFQLVNQKIYNANNYFQPLDVTKK